VYWNGVANQLNTAAAPAAPFKNTSQNATPRMRLLIAHNPHRVVQGKERMIITAHIIRIRSVFHPWLRPPARFTFTRLFPANVRTRASAPSGQVSFLAF
jgi:hypothetical protein